MDLSLFTLALSWCVSVLFLSSHVPLWHFFSISNSNWCEFVGRGQDVEDLGGKFSCVPAYTRVDNHAVSADENF